MRLLTIRLFLACLALCGFTTEIVAATGARQLSDLNPGAVGSYPSNFTAFGGALYFSAYTFQTGFELWRYDGATVSLAADINPTADDIGGGLFEGNDSLPTWLTEFGGHLYLSAFHPARGAELWRFDGTQATRVSDINPDANDAIKAFQNSSWPYQITVLNNALYFGATSSTIPEDYELWSYNASGVQRVANVHPDVGTNHSSYPTGFTTFNGSLYFMADDGAHGWELWRYDGVETKLFDLNPGGADSGSYPKDFTPFNNELYFAAFHAESGFELWRADGNTATIAADSLPGSESSYPKYLAAYNGALYFQGFDATAGFELLKFSGGLTTMAADINPSGDAAPKNLTVLGSFLVFSASDGVHGFELWKYDGNSATMISDLNPSGDSFPEEFTILDGVLYFTATTPDTGYEVWKFDGNAISPAADVNGGPGDSFPRSLTVVNGRLYFSAADDGSSNWEPWMLDMGASSNQPPTVSLTAPVSGALFVTTDNINFSADAADDAGVSRVEFYANTTWIGTDSSGPFAATTSLAAGTYTLTARAFDASGAGATSAPVTITVQDATGNEPPTITLASAQVGQTLASPTTINLSASAADADGIADVVFFNGATVISTDTTAPYEVTASNLGPGNYAFTAVARDNRGATTTSATIEVRVAETPRLEVARDGLSIVLTITVTSGIPHSIQSSPDLVNWTTIYTQTSSSGMITFREDATGIRRFYRAVAQ